MALHESQITAPKFLCLQTETEGLNSRWILCLRSSFYTQFKLAILDRMSSGHLCASVSFWLVVHMHNAAKLKTEVYKWVSLYYDFYDISLQELRGLKTRCCSSWKDEAFEKIPPVLISSVPVPVLKQSPPKLSHLFLLLAAYPAILKRIGWHIIQVQE